MKNLFNYNIELQKLCNETIELVYQQNYYVVRNKVALMKDKLQSLIEKSVNLPNFNEQRDAFLFVISEIVEAIERLDYIFLADMLELKMLPLLIDMQALLRDELGLEFWEENWNYNIQQLANLNPKLKELVVKEKDKWLQETECKYWLEPTSSGLQTLASSDDKGTYYYHSNGNPQKEARTFAEWYSNTSIKRYVIFGFGLGYHVSELAGIHDGAEIYVYESEIRILMLAVMANSLDWLWMNSKVHLLYDLDYTQLSKNLEGIDSVGTSDKELIIHYPSLRHIKYANIRESFEQLFIRDSGIRNQSPQMYINFINNIDNCDDNVSVLRKDLKNKRAIIVAAGPSLDKNVSLLLDKKDDMVIISTGTVFRKLLKLGVDVDYVIVADAKKNTVVQFEEIWEEKVPLIVLSTAYYGFAEKYKGKKYIILQNDYKEAERVALEQQVDLFSTGGSVSTTALDVCIRMGCKDICFIGLDLAYTDGFAHAENSAGSRNRDLSELDSVIGYEFVEEAGNTRFIEKEVKSNRLFGMYQKWIEKRVSEKDVTMSIYDATEGGVLFKGLRVVRFAEYLQAE